jgi:hypothetical protein
MAVVLKRREICEKLYKTLHVTKQTKDIHGALRMLIYENATTNLFHLKNCDVSLGNIAKHVYSSQAILLLRILNCILKV